jgi:hypothetical protein
MINVVGVVSVVIFYILILAVGMWAARKNSGVEGDQEVKNPFPGLNFINVLRPAFAPIVLRQ